MPRLKRPYDCTDALFRPRRLDLFSLILAKLYCGIWNLPGEEILLKVWLPLIISRVSLVTSD